MTQRDRILLTVVGLAALLAGFWFGVLKPKRAEVQALDQQLVQQQTRLTEAQAAIAAGEQARKSFADDYATVAKLGKAVPADEQFPSLVYQLQSAASKTGVDFRVLKRRPTGATAAPAPAANGVPATQAATATAAPGTVVGPAGFPTMPFTFKFEGEFFRMERMLSAVERFTETFGENGQIVSNGRLLTVDGFAIGGSKLRGFPYVSASVTATAYLLPPGEDAFAGATPSGPGTGTTAPGATPGATPPGGTPTPAPAGTASTSKPTTAVATGVTP